MNAKSMLFFSDRFHREIRKLDKKDKEKLINILDDICDKLSSSPADISSYLISKYNSKKYDQYGNIYKFYANGSHRVIYKFYKNLKKDSNNNIIDDNSIFLLSYVTDHDRQSQIASTINPDNYLFHEYFYENYDVQETEEELTYAKDYDLDKNITYYVTQEKIASFIRSYHLTGIPLLNSQQQKYAKSKPPTIIIGNAGSGKTLVSINIVDFIKNIGMNYLYLTLTDELVEYVKSIAEEFGDENKDRYFSFYDYCLRKLNLKKLNYMDLRKFINWYNDNCFHYPYSPIDVWAEIRGKIKGYMEDNWDRDYSKSLIDRNVYYEIADKYCKYDIDDRKQIYSIAEKYNWWLEQNRYYDDNDLARLMINLISKNPSIKTDNIVVDEVQDLTELQIYMIKMLCKYNSLYFIGDSNQIISPTLFSFERLRKYLFINDIKKEPLILKNNYRNDYKIVEYINEVTKMRKKLIGHQKEEYDLEEIPMKEPTADNKIFSISYNINNLEKIVQLFSEQPLSAIIVSDELAKKKLLEKLRYNELDFVYTVMEAKGCEYNHVLCLNLLSDNYNDWLEIFNGEGRRSSSHRYYFNLYYVSLTRAKNTLFFMEENSDTKSFRFSGQEFDTIETVDDDILIITEAKSPEEWYEAGLKLEKNSQYEKAIKNYEKYNAMTNSNYDTPIVRCQAKILYATGNSKDDFEKAGRIFMNIEEWEWAEKAFYNSGNELKRLEAILHFNPEQIKEEELTRIIKFIENDQVDDEFMNVLINNYLLNLIDRSSESILEKTYDIEEAIRGLNNVQ